MKPERRNVFAAEQQISISSSTGFLAPGKEQVSGRRTRERRHEREKKFAGACDYGANKRLLGSRLIQTLISHSIIVVFISRTCLLNFDNARDWLRKATTSLSYT